MTRNVLGFVVLVVVIVVGIIARDLWAPGPGPSGSVEITIERGRSIREIARDLQAQRIIRSARSFMWLARGLKSDRSIQAGNYILPRRRTPGAILNILVRGDIARSLVTIPEGLRIEQVASILSHEAHMDSTTFVRICFDARFADSLGVGRVGLEGYLFPETYSVLLGSPPRELASRMARLALREYAMVSTGLTPPAGMTRGEIMTLASIIQSEAKVAEEMPRISAVFHNRLKQGWKLEADPTVQYALGGHKPRILYDDLEVDSPYNTYRHEGLPPGPICSPGREAIRAALMPSPSERSLYFVARGDGTHVFTQSLDEHLRARAAVKREP